MKVAFLLGVAGTDVPIEEITTLLKPHWVRLQFLLSSVICTIGLLITTSEIDHNNCVYNV